MSKHLITNVKIVLTDKILTDYDILVSEGIIREILPSGKLSAEIVIDGKGNYLCPGLIDLHIHGTHEYLIDNGVGDLERICEILPRYGVTGFLPTVCPLPKGKDSAFLRQLAQVKSQGTKILGFHLEGPFLTLTGALPPEALGSADKDRVEKLIEAAKPYPAIFSVAPDFDKITDLLPLMTGGNRPAFITHTRANVKQTLEALQAGACHATHFYDVFYLPKETEPGVRPTGAVEAILASENVSVDFILDGEHVDPIVLKMALRCKGKDKVCLITDANIGAGSKPGKYKFGKEEVEFSYFGGPARLVKNGGLAGSGLTMNTAVRNAMKLLGVDLPLAVKMASTNPANVLRLNHTGKLAKGLQADMFLMNNQCDVIQTWINGKCCYKA